MSINKDQVKGRVKEAEVKIQEVAGKAVGNSNQQMKGTIKKNVGAAQAKFGDAKSDVKDSKKREPFRRTTLTADPADTEQGIGIARVMALGETMRRLRAVHGPRW